MQVEREEKLAAVVAVTTALLRASYGAVLHGAAESRPGRAAICLPEMLIARAASETAGGARLFEKWISYKRVSVGRTTSSTLLLFETGIFVSLSRLAEAEIGSGLGATASTDDRKGDRRRPGLSALSPTCRRPSAGVLVFEMNFPSHQRPRKQFLQN